MPSVTITLSDDVHRAFEAAFPGETGPRLIAELVERAVREKQRQDGEAEAMARRREAVEAVLKSGT